ncbi:Imm49 family immunity protein [Streptomyces sp. NPDC053560]|uniref:Imm49 family immunity protein n=1 Tax=Streptomyces sp. NPDC053560 TaxID=3365711 RepID=UPI0037D6F284
MQDYAPGHFVRTHEVAADRLAAALDGIDRRAMGAYWDMTNGNVLRSELQDLQNELLDFAAAHVGPEPALAAPEAHASLLTAAECALGLLSLGCFPDGDWDVRLPLIGQTLESERHTYQEARDPWRTAATARTWTDAFGLCLISDLIWDRSKMIGPLLQGDYAPTIRDGVPYSRWESPSSAADLAEMDALAMYLHVVRPERSPWVAQGPVPVRRPDAESRARAAAQLDAAGELSPDQQLVRVLLDDDRASFEHALVGRLVAYRTEMDAEPAPAVRSLLPVSTVTLAVLAVLAHGWQLNATSDYVPAGLLRVPQQTATN